MTHIPEPDMVIRRLKEMLDDRSVTHDTIMSYINGLESGDILSDNILPDVLPDILPDILSGILYELSDMLYRAFSGGRTPFIEFLYEKFGLDTIHCIQQNHIRIAIQMGNIDSIKWAANHDHVYHIINRDKNPLFRKACQHGRLEIAQYIAEEFCEFEPNKFSHKPNWLYEPNMLHEICASGYLYIVKWFVEKFYGMNDERCEYSGERCIFCRHYCCNSNGDKISHIAVVSCKSGNLELVQWLVTYFKMNIDDIIGPKYITAFYIACLNSHFHIAQYLIDQFGLVRADATPQITTAIHHTLIMACQKSNLRLIIFLIDQFAITADDIVCDLPAGKLPTTDLPAGKSPATDLQTTNKRPPIDMPPFTRIRTIYEYCPLIASCFLPMNVVILNFLYIRFNLREFIREHPERQYVINVAFEYACIASQISFDNAVWLYTNFTIDRNLIAISDGSILRSCFTTHNNKTAMFEWLSERFDITAGVVRMDDNYIIRMISYHERNSELLKRIIVTFDLNIEDIRANNDEVFKNVCSRIGDVDLIKWFIENGMVTKQDIEQSNFDVFRRACIHNRLKVAQYLAAEYKITNGEINVNNFMSHVIGTYYNNYEVAQWLVDTFGFTREDCDGSDASGILVFPESDGCFSTKSAAKTR